MIEVGILKTGDKHALVRSRLFFNPKIIIYCIPHDYNVHNGVITTIMTSYPLLKWKKDLRIIVFLPMNKNNVVIN